MTFPIIFSAVFFAKTVLSAPLDTTERTALPVGGSVEFVCVTETIAVWTKEERDASMKSIAAGDVALPGVDTSRYSFSRKGNNFRIQIKNVQTSDSGKFICNNVNEYYLIVIETPKCLPNVDALEEDQHVEFTCETSLHQFEKEKKGEIEWKFGETDLHGVEAGGSSSSSSSSSSTSLRSAVSYTAKHVDHGKRLQCVVKHPDWDANYPFPVCAYNDFNVQFEPKISCPSEMLFFSGQNPFLIKCKIVGNPLPNIEDIEWIFNNNNNDNNNNNNKNERRKFPSFSVKEDSIEATLKLTTHHLSVRNSNLNVTLQIPNKVGRGNAGANTKFVRKSIVARFVHGPNISCNKNIIVGNKNKNKNKPEMTQIRCDVHVNPIPPNSNISWYVDDDFIQVNFIFRRTCLF